MDNVVRPERKRPEDEFADLKSLEVIGTTDITGDGSIIKMMLTEG